jgi:ribosome maturation factor RimP
MFVTEDLKKKIEDIITSFGYTVFCFKSFSFGQKSTIKILIDKPEGGITIKECAEVNQKLCAFFDADYPQAGNLTLEISSPGVDWPLKERRDFQRIISHKIRVFLKQPLRGKWELVGILREAKDNSLSLDLGDENLELNFDNILRSREEY